MHLPQFALTWRGRVGVSDDVPVLEEVVDYLSHLITN